MFGDPFIVDVEGLSEDLQMEIIDLQSNNDLRSKHRELSALQFYHTLPSNIFPNVCALAMRMAAVFGSTYICEQTFPRMKIVKSKTRSQLTDGHLHDLLRLSVSNLIVEVDQLVKSKQAQIAK